MQLFFRHAQSRQLKQLPQQLHRMLWVVDRVANSPTVAEDLVVVAAGHALVAEEVDVLVLDAGRFLFGLEVAQAVGLVPAGGEDVEGDLAADGVAVRY